MVRYIAREAGIRQFLDLGTGIPTAGNLHEVAQAIAPETRVVYVDYDRYKSGCGYTGQKYQPPAISTAAGNWLWAPMWILDYDGIETMRTGPETAKGPAKRGPRQVHTR
jgi:hypothetical protein